MFTIVVRPLTMMLRYFLHRQAARPSSARPANDGVAASAAAAAARAGRPVSAREAHRKQQEDVSSYSCFTVWLMISKEGNMTTGAN